jgi:helix-turn-helix protein
VTAAQRDRAVLNAHGAYCFGEAICWPSQHTIASDLGCSQATVSRSIKRLIGDGHMELIEKRPGRRGWVHHVYALLGAWRPVSRWAAKQIVDRARRRRPRGLHTNPRGQGHRDITNGAPEGLPGDFHRPGSVRSATRGSP